MVRMILPVADGGFGPGYEDNPGFLRSIAVFGLGQCGLVLQDGLRKLFEAVEQGLQLSILQGGRLIKGSGLRGELHIDCFAIDLIGELEVGPVSLGGI